MRPQLKILDEALIKRILAEAQRILAEIGIEVRGPRLRQHLLDHGLKLDTAGERILFPPEVVDQAVATTPRSFTLYNRDGQPHAELGGDNVHYVPGSSGSRCWITVPAKPAWPTVLTSWNTRAFVMGWSISPTWPLPSLPTTTSSRKSPMPGGSTCV